MQGSTSSKPEKQSTDIFIDDHHNSEVRLPFGAGTDGEFRPYLWLAVRTRNGGTRNLRGLIDTGADHSVFPEGYIHLLGLTPDDIEPGEARQVVGNVPTFSPKEPLSAHFPEDPSTAFTFTPVFVEGADVVLWGLFDFLAEWDMVISRSSKELRLAPRAA